MRTSPRRSKEALTSILPYHLTPTKVAVSSIAFSKVCHMAAGSPETARHGCLTGTTSRYGGNGPTWLAWAERHWFFHDRNNLFRRTAESRAMRRDLEEILQEFWRGDPDGPVAQRLIEANAKEAARQRQIWDARLARRDRLIPSLPPIDGGPR
jgi:hypothetical protein